MEKERLEYLEIKKTIKGVKISNSLKVAILITGLLVIGILLFSKLFLD